MSKDYGFTAEQIDTLANKPSSELTEKERLAVNTFFSELVAHESAMLFGNVDFVSRVILRDASFAKKFFAKIADLKKAFSRISDPAAKAEYKRLRAAESVWLSAAKSARSAYFIRYMVSRDDELKEEAEKIDVDKKPEIKYNKKDNNKRTYYSYSQYNTTPEGVEVSKITADMTDSERYEVLKDRSISLSAEVNYKTLAAVQKKLDFDESSVEYSKYGDRVRLFKKIGAEFKVYKRYNNDDIKLDFAFSKEKMRESVSKQRKNYITLAKMLTCFDEVVDNAIGIEVHNRNAEGYKPDDTLENMYVLASAFVDGNDIIPVKLEVKELSDKENTLHVAIALESIQKDEIVKQEDAMNGVARQYSPSSTISIAEYFRKVNPSDESFVKYIPDGFLNEVQLEAKATTNKTPTQNPDIRFDLVEKKNGEISVTDDEYNFTVNKESNTPPDDPYYEDFLLQEIAVRQAENVELKDKNEKVNSVAKLADKFKEMSFGAFQNATQFHPDILQKIQREMAKIEWRGNFKTPNA